MQSINRDPTVLKTIQLFIFLIRKDSVMSFREENHNDNQSGVKRISADKLPPSVLSII